ncbi:MAG: hypothetical protein KAW87_05590 [Candidatus Cloacimonetes bacterium]|nr:hypothetical protein [Candidatus Cloacimonadota bacterium]
MSNAKLKEEYWKRRKKVRSSLIKWGIKKGLVNDIDREHSVGVLEKIIKVTKNRNPKNPAKYFLKGLNYSRIKHGRSSFSVSLNNKSKSGKRDE